MTGIPARGKIACNQCHLERGYGVHPCPHCKCPEYSLNPDDARAWDVVAAARAAAKRAGVGRRKAKGGMP